MVLTLKKRSSVMVSETAAAFHEASQRKHLQWW